MKIREKLYRVVEKDTEYFEWYDIMMLICIWVSIVPLIFKEQNKFTYVITIITTLIFVIDYILRWITSDYRLKKGVISFIKYPITFSAIFDLTIIISCFSEFYNNPILTLFSTFRILMIAKTLRYSKKFKIIKNVVEKNKDILKVVCGFTIGFIFVSALIMFQFEGQSFNNFFEALYWATTALTTVGYGDIYPKTMAGRIISMVTSIFGITIIALPSGVITASIIKEINKGKS